MSEPQKRLSNDPMHGVTLEKILVDLRHHYGWEWMGEQVPVRCFLLDPSIKSSLKFLRRTPWARSKVENLYWRYLTDIEGQELESGEK
jgi:uncharacterized protein (DUF2132 family)